VLLDPSGLYHAAAAASAPPLEGEMILSTNEQAALRRIFGLLAEDLHEREIRARIGTALLDLLRADQFASFVWDQRQQRFGSGLWLNMDDANLARYDAYYQFHDPITFALQSRRHATAVSEVMPHGELARTEFFNDFLARDGLHWGINLHAFDGARALGDLRIWRGRRRREFDAHDRALLDLLEPAFVAALERCTRPPAQPALAMLKQTLSPRELEVARRVGRGLTDKQIALELAVGVTTVRTHLQRIFHKTGVQRRAALAALAERGSSAH
jgi:DNA-binding CsgD family transcriptional regulator